MSFGGFGTNPTTSSFGTSTFGQPAQQTSVFGASTPTSTFGSQPAAPSTTSAWPSFGNTATTGFGASPAPNTNVKAGTQHTPYTTTTEATGKGRLIAITAMPAYKDKSFEELRYEDYCSLKGQTPVPTMQPSSAAAGFGASTPFGSSSASTGFGATPNTTPAGGFGASSSTTTPGTSSWGTSSGFGGSTTSTFGSGLASNTTSTFGQPASSPFGASTTTTTPSFGFGSSQPSTSGFGTSASTTTGFGSAAPSTTGFGTTPSTGFGASSTTSGFGSTTAPNTGFGTSTFGSTPAATTGFGTSTFGQPSTAPSTFGTSTFGNTPAPSTPAFGQSTTPSTGLFGTTQTPPSTGGFFGSTTTPSTNGSLFGNTQPTTGTTTGGLFGQPAVSTTTGGLFGQPSTTAQPFGSATTTPAPSNSLFGTTTTTPSTGGLFGSTATAQPSGGLFGQQNKPAASSPFSFGSATTAAPSTTTAFGSSSGGLFGSQPTSTTAPSSSTTSLFGTTQQPTTTSPSTNFGFGAAPSTQPSTSLFGGTSTTTPAAAPSSFSFGATPSTTSATQPSLFGTGQQSSLFGAGSTAAKPATTSLFGTPSTTTPSSTFQFGSAQPTSTLPSTQPSLTGGLFGGFGTPSTSTQLTVTTPQTQLQQLQTQLKPPPSIDSNPFGLKELPEKRPDSTNLTFQSSTPAATPKTALQHPGFTSTKPTPQSVARLRTRVRHAGPMTPTASLSPFDDKIFSISTLTSASKSVIPKVFRPQMPPKVQLDERPATPVQSPPIVNGTRSALNHTANSSHVEDGRRSLNSVLESPVPSSPATLNSRALLTNCRSLADRGYRFTPSLQALESMSENQLRCVTLQIMKDGCGFARWTDFDLLTWANHDLTELISITEKTVKLKGPAKRGNVICGIKAKTEVQNSKGYEEKVRQFMAAKGFELLGLEDGYYSFKCNFGESLSAATTPSVPPFKIR